MGVSADIGVPVCFPSGFWDPTMEYDQDSLHLHLQAVNEPIVSFKGNTALIPPSFSGTYFWAAN